MQGRPPGGANPFLFFQEKKRFGAKEKKVPLVSYALLSTAAPAFDTAAPCNGLQPVQPVIGSFCTRKGG